MPVSKEQSRQDYVFLPGRPARGLYSVHRPGYVPRVCHNGSLYCIWLHRNINNFYEKIKFLTEKNLYGKYILENYSEEEIKELEKVMDPKRDRLLTYSSR